LDHPNKPTFPLATIAIAAAGLVSLLGSSCRGPAEVRRPREPISLPSHDLKEEAQHAVQNVLEQVRQLGNGEITLEQLLAFASTQNPGLEVKRQRALSSHEAALASGTMPEPTVAWTEFCEEVETRVGPQERRFEVSQKLPWYGALEADIESAQARARAQSTAIESKERELFAQIESLLWRLSLYRQSAALELGRVELFESISATIDGRYRTGKAEYADLLRSRSEIERAKELHEVALDGMQKTEVILRRELGWPAAAALPKVNLPFGPDLAPYRSEQLDQLATNPALVRLAHMEDAARGNLEGLQFDRKPDITVGAFLIATGLGDNPLVPENGQDATGVKLSLSLPIRKSAYDARERSAQHEIRALRRQREDVLVGLQSAVAVAEDDMQAAERRRDLIAHSLLPRAQEILDTTRAGYSSGRATYLDLVNAGNSQISLQLELVRAKVDRELARIEIEMHLGPAHSTPATQSEETLLLSSPKSSS
jgi:cobalt-zinc-cadmium efflux system outer membrane protein